MKIYSIPKLGDANEDVKIFQRAVNNNIVPLTPIEVDGVFGPRTKDTVSLIQMKMGFTGTGNPGPKTLAALGLELVQPMDLQPMTRDLKGKKDRFLHPKMRLLIEREILAGGMFPESFRNRNIPQMVVDTALAMEHLQVLEEGGNNRGQKVGWIQSVVGPDTELGNGDAWCMSTVQCIIAFIEDYLGVESPLIASENCMAVKNAAEKIPGLFVKDARPGSFFIMGYTAVTGHTGTVLRLERNLRMETYEGNTGDGSVNDGDGAFLRNRPSLGKIGKGVIHGFALVYPNNQAPKEV